MNHNGFDLEEYIKIKKSLSNLKGQATSLSNDNKKIFMDKYNDIDNYTHAKNKGDKLEDLIFFIIDNMPIFKGYKNVRTSPNEIDILVILSDEGKMLLRDGLINLKSDTILIECKNYSKKTIDVTMVGKFCSLLLQSPSRLGLFISRKGFAGHGKWDSSKGLVKKFYYHKERYDEKQYVLDLTAEEIKYSVINNSFIELINSKIIALENDTKYEHFITAHPAEDNLNNIEC